MRRRTKDERTNGRIEFVFVLGHSSFVRSWGRPPYFDIVGEEHRAARERVALFDMTSFGKIDVRGRDALRFLQYLADNDVDKPVGSLTYTQFLNERGGIESDVTIARMGEEHFRVVTGTSFLASDLGWMEMYVAGGQVAGKQVVGGEEDRTWSLELDDVTEGYACLGLWGPAARRVLELVANEDVSNAGFPYMTAKRLGIGGIELWAQRVSYVGELGWELFCENKDAVRIWNGLMEAGEPFGISPAGYKALEVCGWRNVIGHWSVDMTPGETPYEAGLGFAVRLGKGDFVGRDALVEQKTRGHRAQVNPVDPH